MPEENHRGTPRKDSGRAPTQRIPLSPEHNRVSGAIVNAAFNIHKALGPGLLESIYEKCLTYELGQAGLQVDTQVSVPVHYKSMVFDEGLRIDLLVNRLVVVELKAVEAILPVHHAQLLTYLKLSNLRLGLLINFNVPVLRDGLVRVIL